MTCNTFPPLVQDGALINGAEEPSIRLEDATIPQLAVLFDLMEQVEDTILGVSNQPRAECLPSERAEQMLLRCDAERLAIIDEIRRRRPQTQTEAEHRMAVLLRHVRAVGESVHGVLQVALECAAQRH